MKNLKINFLILLFAAFFSVGISGVKAEEVTNPEENIPSVPEPVPKIENIIIRYNDTVIYQGEVALPSAGDIDIPDNTGTIHKINPQSILGFLYSLSQSSSAFSLSNLQYYDSYNSFYLKCITLNNVNELCDNWQYVVNGVTPFASMDSVILVGGEAIGMYFGSPHKVVLDATTLDTGGTLTTQAMKYNYIDNTWERLLGVTIGVTVTNPEDPYNPTLIDSHLVNEEGVANFTFNNVGDYNIGISEDYYFPSYSIKVSQPVIHDSGGSGVVEKKSFNISNAIDFIKNLQNSDGSFGSDMYTDWASIAMSAMGGTNINQTNLIEYFKSHIPPASSLTDNERRVIALLANGQNPYSFYGVNYVKVILDSFDGKQFGDPNMINDDVFALIPLSNVGYSYDDFIVNQDVKFIILKQSTNGSWVDSIDMTAATIQALKPFDFVPEVHDSISKASDYIKSLQGEDGGFGSAYSTSWAMQAMNILEASWIRNNNTPADYLATLQFPDGAILPISENISDRIWATSYAIPAVIGKSWAQIMQKVEKPKSEDIVKKEILNMNNDPVFAETKGVNVSDIKVIEENEDLENKELVLNKANTKNIENLGINTEPESSLKEVNNNIDSSAMVASVGENKNELPKYITLGTIILLVVIFSSRKLLAKIYRKN